jgi:hypothetical protein
MSSSPSSIGPERCLLLLTWILRVSPSICKGVDDPSILGGSCSLIQPDKSSVFPLPVIMCCLDHWFCYMCRQSVKYRRGRTTTFKVF